MGRKNKPDFIALGCAALYTLCFSVLPFYRIMVVNLSGWNVMQYINPILCIPLILGLLMCLCSVLIDERISIGIGCAAFLATIILVLSGGAVLINGNGLTQMLGDSINRFVGANVTTMLPVSLGVGGVLCVLLSILYIGMECYWATQKKKIVEIEQPQCVFPDPYGMGSDKSFSSNSVGGFPNNNDWSI